jgi:hypothetical protein
MYLYSYVWEFKVYMSLHFVKEALLQNKQTLESTSFSDFKSKLTILFRNVTFYFFGVSGNSSVVFSPICSIVNRSASFDRLVSYQCSHSRNISKLTFRPMGVPIASQCNQKKAPNLKRCRTSLLIGCNLHSTG